MGVKKLGNISKFNLDRQEDKSFNDLDNISICFSEGIRKVVEMNLNNYKNKISKYLNETSKIELLEPKELTIVISKGYPDYLMSVEEASKRLKIDKVFGYELIKNGLLKSVDIGATKVSSYELDDLITRNQGKNIKEMLREMKELREGVIQLSVKVLIAYVQFCKQYNKKASFESLKKYNKGVIA